MGKISVPDSILLKSGKLTPEEFKIMTTHVDSGEDIPLSARIVALADCFDALSTERCYKKAYNFKESLDIVRSERGMHFDPAVVDAFEEVIKNQIS